MTDSNSNPGQTSQNFDPASAERIRLSRKQRLSVKELADEILVGNKASLARGITLIESNQPKHREEASLLLEKCLPFANKSFRVGITGVPGVGKSTFIEVFGKLLLSMGKKVAVLAVDPTSTVSGGSILGDKTRMEELVKREDAFIRPSPSGNSLGGVSRKTRESIILCESAGFDMVLIETVGVGQSEVAVHGMTDFFLLLKLAGAGDELQGIKRGIVEMADLIVINKADGENQKAAKRAKTEFSRALHLYPAKKSGWQPKTLLASSLYDEGIEEIWELVIKFGEQVKSNGYFSANRKEQNKSWLLQSIDEGLKNDFYQDPKIKKVLEEQLKAVAENKTTPFEAANYLLGLKK